MIPGSTTLKTLFIGASLSFALALFNASAAAPAVPSDRLERFVDEMARKHNFDRQELTVLLRGAERKERILKAIASPAEAKPWYDYRPIFVTRSRISEGVRFWQENEAALARAAEVYGVPPEIIVAIIGVETRYGRHKGGFRVLDSLTTLAFNYPKRAAFFLRELEQFLLLAREENLDPLKPLGSYAGAMGRPQFISSSYRHYAVDFDNDGFRDLWENNADAIGSVANYFSRHGWQPGQPVVRPAQVEGEGYRAVLSDSPDTNQTAGTLRRNGVRFDEKIGDDMAATLFALETREGPEYWVGFRNFYVITRYNRSILYAMAVYQLSQEILARQREARRTALKETT
ncbi:MAG: lytic murein transglycosylase B [Gammaproteobacteria bacterium]